jgi:hypothetical protein
VIHIPPSEIKEIIPNDWFEEADKALEDVKMITDPKEREGDQRPR